MLKRMFLFLTVNFLVVITISTVLNLLGIRPYLDARGIDYKSLFIFCAAWGFLGSFISLALSRVMAKFAMRVTVIDPSAPGSSQEKELVFLVHRLAQKAGLSVMPEVGIYSSPEVNAFATGPSKSRSLVAVSTGLLDRMDPGAVEGVLGHEIAHIANGDMVTMTLLQGVINTFVMFLSRIAAWALSNAIAGDRDRDRTPSPWIYYGTQMLFEIVFSLLGAIVVCAFSRRREFRADKGGAQFAGREKMVHALQSLKGTLEQVDQGHPALASFKISGRPKGLLALLSTHPDLDTRIERLRSSV
ncbi:MAG: protease HtpX [Proteobacteria bacterium]|nr:protease HtpX [Pseudomonadota bacterium]NDG26075.1 protease HtpX [Pseudomonadota bacterium]